jgi:uridine kinase
MEAWMPDHMGPDHEKKAARVLIGIAGGSAAGKTTLALALTAALGSRRVLHLQQDWYYRDLSHVDPAARAAHNFDQPEALEMDLLGQHLRLLRRGETVRRPDYDFATHTRLDEWQVLTPRELVLLEGTLVLADPVLRELLDIRIYVDAPRSTRLARRLTRDIAERGRDVSSCLHQHWHTVWPMHDLYVGPSRRHADVLVAGDALSSKVVDALAQRVEERAARARSAA